MSMPGKKPEWLRVKLATGNRFSGLRRIVSEGNLHTVCQEAMCPNMGECWNHGRATLMILGDTCSRSCRFCNIGSGRPPGNCDMGEPARVGDAVGRMGLDEVVITSVTRDDLPDGGAGIWVETIRSIRERNPGIQIEVLVPDFQGNRHAFDLVARERPAVFGHNLETVRQMYQKVRPQADYNQSLNMLNRAFQSGLVTKTGIMVGIGETDCQIMKLMDDAVSTGCQVLYIGQYLQPSKKHWPVDRYVEPYKFEEYRTEALAKGFSVVVSGPLVRSSYYSEAQAGYVNKLLQK